MWASVCVYVCVLTCALYEELLPVAAQQGAREEGSEVHEDLPQQGGRLLQGMLQTLRDAGGMHTHKNT